MGDSGTASTMGGRRQVGLEGRQSKEKEGDGVPKVRERGGGGVIGNDRSCDRMTLLTNLVSSPGIIYRCMPRTALSEMSDIIISWIKDYYACIYSNSICISCTENAAEIFVA
jgi:hypothetical protein